MVLFYLSGAFKKLIGMLKPTVVVGVYMSEGITKTGHLCVTFIVGRQNAASACVKRQKEVSKKGYMTHKQIKC